MFKKIFCTLLVLLLSCSMSISGFATSAAVVEVSSGMVDAGERIELHVSVTANPGISGVGLTLEYDQNALTLVDIVNDAGGNFVKNLDGSSFTWVYGSNKTDEFQIVTLIFEADSSANGIFPVSAKLTRDLPGNLTNAMAEAVPVRFVSGTVTVTEVHSPDPDPTPPSGGSGGGSSGGSMGNGSDSDIGGSADSSMTEEISPLFEDIPNDAYYSDAVYWAAQQGITNGITETTFSPNTVCTRAQMVTFLWRANGCPEPKAIICKFQDVDMNSYYSKAVLWAIEEGITNGTTDTTFSPINPCTRGQMAAFLSRMTDGQAVGASSPFIDVPAGIYYSKAVQWAVESGITVGTTSTTYSPEAPCTRSQMVTFLYRLLAT